MPSQYRELVEANLHPLNQRCKELIQTIGEWVPNPGLLYSLQLMFWALNLGQSGQSDIRNERLLNSVLKLHDRNPDEAMLALHLVGEETSLDVADLDDLTPMQAAQQLLLVLHYRLMEWDNSYPPPEHWA